MKKRIQLVLLLLPLLAATAFSQSPDWLWAKAMGGTVDDFGTSIAIDPAGSGAVYTTGGFVGTVDFDPGPGIFNLASVAGSEDIFISKLDSLGNFVWAKAMSGGGNDHGQSIAIDPAGSGDVYTTGYFSDTVDFDPGAGVFNLTGAGTFISKLDSSGNFVWAKAIIGTVNWYNSYPIAIDPAGSGAVHTAGAFVGTVDFDPDTGVFNLTSVPGAADIFISKLDSSGNFVWAKAMGGTSADWCNFIAIDPGGSGDVYTTGVFSGIADFDPGAGVFNLAILGGLGDIFISKLDASGNFVWAKGMGDYDNDYGNSIAIDPTSGDVYTTGNFSGTVDFDPGAGVFNLTSDGGMFPDIFILKLNSSGNFVWVARMGGTYIDGGKSIAFDPSGSGAIYTTGAFWLSVDFDPGVGVFNLTAAGLTDIFISKLDTSGNFEWAKAEGGANYDYGESIALDASGHVHVTGEFGGPSIAFGSTTLTNAGGWDIFIARLDTAIITRNNEIENLNNGILLFPNPANSQLTIGLPNINKRVELTITDITGKIIYKTIARDPDPDGYREQKIEMNTKDFMEGIYMVKILSEGFIATKKLIVVK